ncbi:DUF6543 domain-containing protein [Pseudomonas sp. SIMBA_077]
MAQTAITNKYEPLVATLLPRWFVTAPNAVREALQKSMALRNETQALTSQVLATVQTAEQFCEPLIKSALSVYGWGDLNVKTNALKQVHLFDNLLIFIARQQVKIVDTLARTLLPADLIPESLELNLVSSISHHNLLQAAMQNFEASETQLGGFDTGSCIYSIGPNNLEILNVSLKPEKFAQICRDLNLGYQYQLHLDRQFTPVENEWAITDPRSKAYKINKAFSDDIRHEFSCALHLEFIKGYLTSASYHFITTLLGEADAYYTSTSASYGTFQILDFEVTGVMVFLPLRKDNTPAQPCIVYLPQGPDRCFYEFESFTAFQTHLREWLRSPLFASYLTKRVPLRHRADFMRRTHIKEPTLDSLLLRRPPIIIEAALFANSHYNPKHENPFKVAWSQHLAQLKDDASLLVVSTDAEDKKARAERQAMYLNMGMSLLGLALGFVPVLGEILLAASVVELGEEVYKGIKAWERNDRFSAINYLFDVAQNVALLASTVGVAKALKAPPQLDAMLPIKVERGATRLWRPSLEGYKFNEVNLNEVKPDTRGVYDVSGKSFIRLEDEIYGIESNHHTDSFHLVHPVDPRAYKIKLRHNNKGTWTFEMDSPLQWGRTKIFKRMGRDAQVLSPQTIDKVMILSDVSDSVLRHVLLEQVPPPAMLVDGLKRAALIERIETFVSKMKNGYNRLDADADLQLRLMTQLPGWPADRVLRVVGNDGVTFREYGHDLLSRIPRVQVTEAQVAHSDLLKVTLDCLTQSQITQLLGEEIAGDQQQILALAKTLGVFAKTNEATLFQIIYNETEVIPAHGRLIKEQFPSLTSSVITELVDHLTPDQIALVLHQERLPLVVLEEARHYVQALRINRAIEGFLYDALSNEDTLTLAKRILPSVPGWPRSLRLVIRDQASGNVLDTIGNPSVTYARELHKSGDYYEYSGHGKGAPFRHKSLLRCIFKTLSQEEISGLTLPTSDPFEAFALKVAKVATEQRSVTSKALGLQEIKPWFKSPLRLADGRFGYPLGGRSGRLLPDSRPQLLKDQVLELYPMMSETQAGHFLFRLSLNPAQIARSLLTLKAELETLRIELDTWVASDVWSYPISGPRFKVTTQVKRLMSREFVRAWRRQTPSSQMGGRIGYEMDLDAWPVDSLPALSADFSHINTLSLSHSAASQFLVRFLEKFKQLRVLTLKNNALVELPAAIADMQELQILNLQGNQIALTPAAHRILVGLTKLKTLNLTGNTLGMRLSVGQLVELENLQLRNTGITQWPEGIESLTQLQLVDLRDNAISHVPQEVLSPARNAVNRVTFLHDNPLSNDSLRRLRIYRREQGINFGLWISRQHIRSPQGIQRWAQVASAEQATVWTSLRAEENSVDFFQVLEDLSASAQYTRDYENLNQRVWALLSAMHKNTGLRAWLFDISTQPRTCGDGIAMVFADLELRLQIYMAEHGLNSEEQLLHLTRGLFRIEALNQHVDSVITQRVALINAEPVTAVNRLQELINAAGSELTDRPLSELSAQECQGLAYKLGTPEALRLAEILSPHWLQTQLGRIDELEIQMFYQVHLAKELALPARPHSMIFENVAKVTPAELQTAKAYVMSQETPETLKASLIARDYWQNFLRFKYKDAFSNSDEVQDAHMEALFTAREVLPDNEYISQVGVVVEEREHARLALVTRFTEQEIEQNPQLRAVLQTPAP